MKDGILSFAEWLEEYKGITWSYFDNNYDGTSADEVFDEYDEYCAKAENNE